MERAVKSPRQPKPGAAPVPGVRKERARATRHRILAAAEAEFLAKGYHATFMADIAARAGVSVQMLYFSFGTKARLLGAIIENAVLGEQTPVDPMKSDWFDQVKQAPTAAETIRQFVLGSGQVFQRTGRIALVGDAGALEDPELAAISRAGDELRAVNFRAVVELAAGKGPLKPGLDIDAATDILVAVYSPALYMEFIDDRGWSDARTLAWLAATVPGLVCAD